MKSIQHLVSNGAGWLLSLLPAGIFAGFLGFASSIEAGRTVTERWSAAR